MILQGGMQGKDGVHDVAGLEHQPVKLAAHRLD